MADLVEFGGMDAETGRFLTGWPHVTQSIAKILTTAFGERTMREYFGSYLPQALGRNINRNELLPVFASISAALDMFEPRFQILTIDVDGQPREGRLVLKIQGLYRPRALHGDMTSEGSRSLSLSAGAGSVKII